MDDKCDGEAKRLVISEASVKDLEVSEAEVEHDDEARLAAAPPHGPSPGGPSPGGKKNHR
jgi:hypothetical protein